MKIAFLAFLFSIASFAWSADKDASAPFTLTVVPSVSSPKVRSIVIADEKPYEFYVVLTNRTRNIQSVFDGMSWGYQNISLEFTMPDGRKLVVTRRPIDFSKNLPLTFLIPAGEHRVYAIRLDKEWEGRPELAAGAEMPVTLKAIYEVTPTFESTEHKVWTGRIESKLYNLTLWQK